MTGRMRFSTAALMALLAGTALATPASAQDAPRIAYFVPSANSWTAVTTAGAKEVIEKAGGVFTIIDSNYNAETQATQVRDAVTSGNYDAFIIMAVDGAGIVPYVEEAAEAGIPVAVDTSVVGTDTSSKDIQVDGIVSSVTLPASLVGGSTGDEIIAQCRDIDPCNVLILLGSRGQTYDVAVLDGIKAKLADAPNVKVVAEAEGGYASDPAFNAMRDQFLAHPDINLLVSYSDPMTNGAVQAAEEMDVTLGDGGVRIVSMGGSQLAKDLILAGKMVSSKVDLPYSQGRIEAESVLQALKGEPVTNSAVYPTADLSPFPFLNATNAADFTPEWAGQ